MARFVPLGWHGIGVSDGWCLRLVMPVSRLFFDEVLHVSHQSGMKRGLDLSPFVCAFWLAAAMLPVWYHGKASIKRSTADQVPIQIW